MIQLSILKFLKNNKVNNIYTEDEKNTSLDKTNTLFVYTDGSCKNNGKHNAIAGIGIYFGKNDNRNLYKTFTGKQSNNTAELTAIQTVYKILEKEIKDNKDITICSDSIYSIRCCTTYGKKNADKNWSIEIPNKELVKTIYNLYKPYKNIHFLHVKAHTGNSDPHSIGNFHADRLANLAISKI